MSHNSAQLDIGHIEQHVAFDLTSKNAVKFQEELNQLRKDSNLTQDLKQINDYLTQHGFPSADQIVYDPTSQLFKFQGTNNALPNFSDTGPSSDTSSSSDTSNGPQTTFPVFGDQSSGGGGGSSGGGGGGGGVGGDGGGGYSGGGGGGGGSFGGGGSDSGAGGGGSGSTGGFNPGQIDSGHSDSLPNLNQDLSMYVNPLQGSGLNQERTDMGVDFGGAGTFVAIGDSKVDAIVPNWYQGQPLMEMTLLDGPLKGQHYFVAEGIQPLHGVGDTVKKGQPLARITSGPTGIEAGWGAGGGQTLAQATTGYHEGQVTPAGQSFADFLHKVGHH